MSAAKGRRLMGQMNVVPYIDVMLVLLIIFMVTAPMLQQGITVNPPDVEAAPVEVTEDNEPIIVSVNAAGELFMNVGETPNEPITERVLLDRMVAVLNVNSATPVYVKGDEALTLGPFARVMALLQRAGATNLGILTETPADLPEVAPE
jgi:biopolymer transport protein TolR